MNLKQIQQYINDNYKISFKEDEYGYEPALFYKTKKDEFYIHLYEDFKKHKCIGYDVMRNNKLMGSAGGYIIKDNIEELIDYIMQEDFNFKRIASKQLSLF